MAKSMMKLVMPLKSISNLSKYTAATRFYCNIKEVPSNLTDIDKSIALYSFMKQPDNAINFIETIKANKHIIDKYHVSLALRSLQTYCKVNAIDPLKFHESITFMSQCLNKHLTTFNPEELISVLRTLHFLHVSSSTMIMQSILQLIRSSINDLSLDHIYVLSPLLKYMKSTNLTKALMHALPKVFEAQLEIQLDLTNIQDLKNAFRYATINNVNKKTLVYIIKAIDSNTEALDVDTALAILLSFYNSGFFPDKYINVLFRMQDFLLNNINRLEKSETKLISFRNLSDYCNGSMAVDGFYNCILLDIFIDKYISADYIDYQGIEILAKLNKLRHINIKLLNYLTTKIHQNKSLATLSLDQIYTLIRAYSLANYKPTYLSELPNIVTKSVFYDSNDIKLCELTIYLASLGCFDPKLIACVFASSNISYPRELQELYQVVKMLYPEYSGPWPSKDLHSVIQSNKPEDNLFHALQKILGGPTYFKSNVRTNLGYLIDYLIVFNNEHPVSIESTTSTDLNSVIDIEDLSIPSNYKRVAVLALPTEAYGSNIPILGARYVQIIKSLEAMSFKVVHLYEDKWMNMPDYEKLPYLQDLLTLRRKEIT